MEEVYHFSKTFLCLILTGYICKSNSCLFLNIYLCITLSYTSHHTAALADLIAPELEKYREESKGLAKSEEDVLSYALFPQVAAKFLEARDNPVPAEAPAPAASDDNSVRTIYVQDLSE